MWKSIEISKIYQQLVWSEMCPWYKVIGNERRFIYIQVYICIYFIRIQHIFLHIKLRGNSKTYNNQYIAFFNPNKLKASAKPLKDSLVYNNKETRDVYEIEFGSRRFLQIGIKSSVNADDIYKKANAAVVGKINVNVEGNKHSLPEKIMKVESGKFLSSNSPEFEVKDYAGFVPMRTGDAVTIAILVIICAAIVAAIVFNVVYFVILKKPCCACCSCCTCCPGNKESNQSEVATVLI